MIPMNSANRKKVAFITGANSGIGLATVKTFLNSNYDVIAHCNSNDSNLLKLKEKLLGIVKADFSLQSSIVEMLQERVFLENNIDILVNNAATYLNFSDFENISLSEVDTVFNVNLKAPMYLTQRLLPNMKSKKWGRVIFVSSCSVKHGGSPRTIHYTMSKSALESLARGVAKEGAPYGVLSNVVRPGFIDTKFHSLNKGKKLEERAKFLMLNRPGDPTEVASMIKFLCSEEASFCTGAIYDVDGGE
ncbi:MAG: SDR family oxidoreductase [Bacteriovoracaceae bacterium]|nr:SDR family oxidoreductase [Bacteriovoracaceae bacterium]